MNKFTQKYANMVKAVFGGKFGKIQAIVFSVNATDDDKELKEKVFSELTLADGIFEKPIKNQTVSLYNEPYKHGFIVREYENGQVLRYTLTCAPIKESTQLTLYGDNGEIRFYSENGKIFTFKQIPDYVGDEYVEDGDLNGFINFEKGVIGSAIVDMSKLANNKEIADKVIKG